MPLLVQFTRLIDRNASPIYVNIDNLLYFTGSTSGEGTFLCFAGGEKIRVQEADTTVDQKIHERMAEVKGTR